MLVVGATNLAALLDDALLRPGRFDRRIYMGNPSAANRFRILQARQMDCDKFQSLPPSLSSAYAR